MAKKKEAVQETITEEVEQQEGSAAGIPTAEEVAAKAEAELAKAERIKDLNELIASTEADLNGYKTELKTLTGKSAVKRGPVGVGKFIKEQIIAGKSNQEILDLVAANFPENFTNVSCVNWYRNALKNWPDGKRPVKKAAAEEAATGELEEGETASDEAEYAEEEETEQAE